MTWNNRKEQERQQSEKARVRIMGAIKTYIGMHGYAPTQAEVSKMTGYSPASVCKRMKELLLDGRIECDLEDVWHQQRAYRLGRVI